MLNNLVVVVSSQGFKGAPGRLAIYEVFDEKGKLLPNKKWSLVGMIGDPMLAGANRIMIQEEHALVASSLSENTARDDTLRANVSMINLKDPSNPYITGSIDFPDKRGPNGLELIGNRAYAAGGQTVQCIDVSNPNKLHQIAVLHSPDSFLTIGKTDDAHDLVLVNEYLYVTSQYSNSLVIIRVRGDALPEK
jgi:hypothetical protein